MPPVSAVAYNPFARTLLGQPRALATLFLTEMWERFSFYGMKALLIYYMIRQLQFTQADASLIYGAYIGGVYLTPIVGGLLADRWLGRRRAILIGGSLMALGHFVLASEALFFPALSAVSDAPGPADFTRNLLRWSEALAAIARTGMGFTQSLYERENDGTQSLGRLVIDRYC